MINANELRIGNLVQRYSNVMEVSGIGKERADLILKQPNTGVDWGMLYEDIYPIPLTEEILLKCGFKKTENIIIANYQLDISWYDKYFKRLSITIEPGNKYLFMTEGHPTGPKDYDETVTLWNGDIKDLFYLHHLQNLYHDLTGNELPFTF